MRDVFHTLRSLQRSPGFSIAAVLAVALGIGAATTVFSVADRLLFRPLPYAHPDRLVTVGGASKARGLTNWAVYADEFDAWRQSSRTLADLAGYQPFGRFTLSLPDAPVEIAVNRITINFLDLLGVAPSLGRRFNASDFALGAPQAVLLTDRIWRRLLAANPGVIGELIMLNGAPTEIARVLPSSFSFPVTRTAIPEALVPLVRTPQSSGSRVSMIGRLREDITIEEARVEIDTIAAARKGESGLRDTRLDGATVERESMAAVLAGLAVGVGAALSLSQYVASLVYEVQPRDPGTYVAVCTLLAAAAVVAALLPARRAALVEPLTALRTE